MRTVAISAAILTAAFFLGTADSQAAAISPISDAANINTLITGSATVADAKNKKAGKPHKSENRQATVELASAEQPVSPAKMVTVQSGDYLMKIATENGTTYQRLYDANTDITNPDLIYPGQQIRIPAADETLTARPLPENAPVEAKQQAAVAPSDSYSAPIQAQQQSAAPAVADGSVWDRLAQCESGGNWAINTGNGFYGGLQFTLASWAAVGGSGMPNQASREEQILRGQILQARGGWGNWPACTAKLGIY